MSFTGIAKHLIDSDQWLFRTLGAKTSAKCWDRTQRGS